MARPPLSDEVLLHTLEVVSKHKTKRAAAKELGVNEQTLYNRLKSAADRGLDGSVPQPLPPGRYVSRTTTLYKNGEEILQWVQAKPDGVDQFVDAIKSVFDEYEGKAQLIPAPTFAHSDLLSIYPVADQHHGLLAWGQETGESYDLAIGAARLRRCMSHLVAQAPPSQQAIILNLGDWQHTDDGRNMTPRGHNLLDVDGRYFKVLETGVLLMVDCIDLALQKHGRVLVRNLPGNHDPHSSIALTIALSAFYRNNDRVTIDGDPGEFFFHRFGTTLIGAHHGHRAKADRLAMVMATERREDWGASKYHYFYKGHYHTEDAKTVGDVRVETFPSLASRDAWTAAQGFGSGNALVGITISEEGGEIGRHRINIQR